MVRLCREHICTRERNANCRRMLELLVQCASPRRSNCFAHQDGNRSCRTYFNVKAHPLLVLWHSITFLTTQSTMQVLEGRQNWEEVVKSLLWLVFTHPSKCDKLPSYWFMCKVEHHYKALCVENTQFIPLTSMVFNIWQDLCTFTDRSLIELLCYRHIMWSAWDCMAAFHPSSFNTGRQMLVLWNNTKYV